MVGTTLTEIRQHIEALASADGDYYLVCGRTGDRPVPAETARFENRGTARAAARATEQYRAALRRYDPRFPYYDLIVCQDNGPLHRPRDVDGNGESADRAASASERARSVDAPDHRLLVEFCHRVAAAVFETLSEKGYDGVESAVMDAYFDLAETVSDPDDLCLRLLESMAAALDERLSPTDQADVLADAATRYAPVESAVDPVASTMSALRDRGLLADYVCEPTATDRPDRTRSVAVDVTDYALSPRNGRLPVLPVVVELFRRRPDWPLSRVRVVGREDRWHVTLELASDAGPDGLASAPIRSET
ncbi:hypothetical protein OB920_10420 [Halobacteria archaeon HArc-gm2]|nr:hypothetical protein [Halobacteria archaeon HArc-gm2]